jgi:ACR3 family arsenite transporter
MIASITGLGSIARHGRAVLVLGLLAGILFPHLALVLRPWIGELVAVLLFIAALRVGPRQAVGALADLRMSIGLALLFQIAFPVAAIFVFRVCGWTGAPATGLVLMMAASPISGSPNLTILAGHDPAPSLRQFVAGTALLPVTVIPVFWLIPSLGDASDVLLSAMRLHAIIILATGGAFAIRGFLLRKPAPQTLAAIDGLSALTMAVVVVGLMSAVGPALRTAPQTLLTTLAIAFAGNFGLQIMVALWLRRAGSRHLAAPLGIAAGNRNIALFLTALPAAVTDPLLLFIGCYQIPMYLTPLLLRGFYRTHQGKRTSCSDLTSD